MMRTHFHFGLYFSLLVLCLVCCTSLNAQLPEWRRYEDSTLNFSLIFPEGVILEPTDTIQTEIGLLERHHRIYNYPGDDDLSVFMISKVDYPIESIHHDSLGLVEDFLKATIEEAVNSIDGELLYQAPDEVLGFPGARWKIAYNKGTAVIQSKAWITNHTYFTLTVVGKRDYSLSEKVEQFYKSFRFLNPPTE